MRSMAPRTSTARKRAPSAVSLASSPRHPGDDPLAAYVPAGIGPIVDHQKDLPRIARDPALYGLLEEALRRIPTHHTLYRGDARAMDFLAPESVHLVVTSPPYWTLKEYRRVEGQLGYVAAYEDFLEQLDAVWKHAHRALVPGGRLIINVGDVCLSRRKNGGRHTVVPLHASIQDRCMRLGFDNLAPIVWNKIANAVYEAHGAPGGFLGKPYEPNAVIKNDVEWILMERKPGGYRSPTLSTRLLSLISGQNHKRWFQQVWTGLTGASTRNHPAPYPVELAERLIRMFSFAGDTVLDPFWGSGSTSVAAARCGRNTIGVEIDPVYFNAAVRRVRQATKSLAAAAILTKESLKPKA